MKAVATPAPAARTGSQDNSAVSNKIKRNELARKTRLRVWGESWDDRQERIREASPFGQYPSWSLNAVVVKAGDDLRQELLASQVIRVFAAIFREAKLPLWLYESEVLVVNSTSGLMECYNDTMSVNGIKKHFPGKSLDEIFKLAFADRLFEAKQNFIESYAAYSLVVWFMQVKDRHNDNLLMLRSGHVVHLDFGYMLSNSPGGNIGFESAPFKLTQEFLDVMDGECSDQYEYFRTLIIRGFLEARKHVDRIVLPVRMLLAGSKLPCFREGADAVLQGMQDRFFSNLTEAACIEKVVDLIDTSVNNWRTIQYDNYQRIVNGIL
jgi:phosphatidylinositol 4-kinase